MEFTEKELDELFEIADSHGNATITKISRSSTQSIVMRLIDFQCVTKYKEYHQISDDLAERVVKYFKWLRSPEGPILDCDIPGFFLVIDPLSES